MPVLFIEYPKCSTCKKAKKWLDDHGVSYTDRHIVEQNPTADELRDWHQRSGLPIKRFVNTSGQLYRSENLKDKLPGMSDEEIFRLSKLDRQTFLQMITDRKQTFSKAVIIRKG